MRKIYLNILFILIIFLICYYFFYYYHKKEAFTPYIRSLYRPYIRNFNFHIDYLSNNYGLQTIFNKLRKWNIY